MTGFTLFRQSCENVFQRVIITSGTRIKLSCLLPHCTRYLHRLEDINFKLLKSVYNKSCDIWIVSNSGKIITIRHRVGLARIAFASFFFQIMIILLKLLFAMKHLYEPHSVFELIFEEFLSYHDCLFCSDSS